MAFRLSFVKPGPHTYLSRVIAAVDTADLHVAVRGARDDLNPLEVTGQNDDITACRVRLKNGKIVLHETAR